MTTATTAARAVTSRGRRAQAGVVAAFVIHGVLFASWAAHIPKVKAHLGIDNGVLGFALLGTPAGSVLATLGSAYVIPRVGSRLLVQICLVGYCLSGPLVGLAGSVPTLFLALFVWGAFQGTLDVSMNTQAIAVERLRARPIMNGMHACWSVGAFAGAGLGTLGVALGVTLSEQLLVLGVPCLVVAGVLSLQMIGDRNAATSQDAASDGGGTSPAGDDTSRRRWRPSLPAAVLLLGAIAFAAMLCEGAATDWSSVYMRDSLGGGAAIAGLGYTAFSLAMVIVRISGNRLLLRFPAQRVLPTLAVVAAVVLAVALAVGTVPMSIVGFFALGLGLGAVVPTAFSAAGRLPGVHAGVGVAAVAALGWAGFVLGPPVIGQLSGLASLPVALAVVPLLCAFVAVAGARVRALRGVVTPAAEPSRTDRVAEL